MAISITVHQRGVKNAIKASDVSIETRVEFKKIKDTGLSDKVIGAYIDGEMLGYISEVPKMLVVGTTCLDSLLYNELPDSFEGVIEKKEELTGKSTQTMFGIKLNIAVSSEISTESVGKTFRLKIKGSANRFPGKTTVLKEYEDDSSKVFVEIYLDEDGLISAKLSDETLAGKVDVKDINGCSTLDEIDILKSILDGSDSIEAKVDDVKGNSYFVVLNVSAEAIEAKEMEMTKSKISNIKNDLVKNGYEEQTLAEIEEYLLNNGFKAEYITDIFSTYKIYEDDVKALIPSGDFLKFEDNEEQLLLTGYSAISNGFNILCSGEKGTGKNVYVKTMTWIYQRPLYSISVSRESDKLDFIGARTIDVEVGEDGGVANKVLFQPEVLVTAMEVGGVINIDEINFADPGITGLLHSIADDRRSIQVPGYKFVNADDNFCIMATMNVDYQGTSELNEALADRFVDIVFPNTDSISAVLEENCPGVRKETIKQADKVYSTLVTQIRDMNASIDSSCLTVRGFVQAVKMAPIIGLKKALITAVAKKIRDEEYRRNVISIIDSHVS